MHGTPCKKDGGRHRNCRMQTPFQTTNAQRPAKKPEQKRRHPIQAGLSDITGISERLRPTDNQACRRQPPHMTTGPVQEIPDDMKQDQVPEKPERWIEGGFSYSEKATQKDFRRHLPDENAFHRSVNQIPEEIGNRQSKHAIHDLSPAGWNKIRRQKKEEKYGGLSDQIEYILSKSMIDHDGDHGQRSRTLDPVYFRFVHYSLWRICPDKRRARHSRSNNMNLQSKIARANRRV